MSIGLTLIAEEFVSMVDIHNCFTWTDTVLDEVLRVRHLRHIYSYFIVQGVEMHKNALKERFSYKLYKAGGNNKVYGS